MREYRNLVSINLVSFDFLNSVFNMYFFTYLFIYLFMGWNEACVLENRYEDQETMFRSWPSHSTLSVLGMKLSSSFIRLGVECLYPPNYQAGPHSTLTFRGVCTPLSTYAPQSCLGLSLYLFFPSISSLFISLSPPFLPLYSSPFLYLQIWLSLHICRRCF